MAWTLLSEPPDIPGLTFRPLKGPDDYPHMADMLNASCAADGIERIETAETIALNYANLDNSDPATDTVFAEIDGRLVAYGRVLWWQEHAGTYRYMPFCMVNGDFRNRGLGTAMLAHNEARLRQIAAGHPEEAEKMLEVYCVDSEPGAMALYRAFGYELGFAEADLVRSDLDDLPTAVLPEGLVVRTPRDDEMRKVWEAADEAFIDHIGSTPGTENDYRQFLGFEWHDPTLWRVAWDGDEVAGQVRSYINERENQEFDRKRGMTEFISVRRPYRRQGLARALLTQSLHAVKERGMLEAGLGVMTENVHGAFRLYESVGFEVVQTGSNFVKPLG